MAALGCDDVLQVLRYTIQALEEEKFFDPATSGTVMKFLHPPQLQAKIPSITEKGIGREEFYEILKMIVRYSVKTSSPHFHNQLYGGVDEYGLAGAWLTEALNTSQYTYEVAPVATLLEREVISLALTYMKYPEMPEGDGIFAPGGSVSNMYGMVLARHWKFPEAKRKGLAGMPSLACFSSEGGHYSITKGAHWLGIGTDNVYKVKTDDLGRMDPEAFQKSVNQAKSDGKVPFFVIATVGTTVLGAIDPVSSIAEICKREKIWLHVDGCLGATLALSKKYRERINGTELSNSMSWNPHKMLGAPFQCSLFLVKGKNALHEANCARANYLFQQDKFYDVSWDTGDKSVQCGRKVDALKFWLMWKARGTEGLENLIDNAISMTDYFFRQIQGRQGFRLVLPKFQCSNICFWFIPPSMRGKEETKEWWEKLYTIAPKIKERMTLEGSLMIGYTPLSSKNFGNFFRMVVTCRPSSTKSSMDYAIEQIEKLGAEL